ncbi:MAG TPA: exodeoxyribonuclease III [Chitinophagales bacterium]|nr:exodeoxyribonuclease III [Chitinophagales bacterium]
MSTYKLLSWNVNGLRAIMKKGFMEWLHAQNGDMVCLQETKLQHDQIPDELAKHEGYRAYYDCAERKGYSGVALFSKREPLRVSTSIGEKFDREGRILIAEYPEFLLYNIYFPNGQMSEERLYYKLAFYDEFLKQVEIQRKQGKKIIIAGDINTAHREIDLARPKANERTSGFLPIERAWLDKLVAHGYTDTFRMFNQRGGQYTYWDQRFNARARNVGWRIDYFFVSDDLKSNVKDAFIQADVMGSDHCPIGLILEV